MTGEIVESRFAVSEGEAEVSAIWMHPPGACRLLVLGHGAGAGMRHAFLQTLAETLAARGIATFRYQFPYMERGTGRPDPPLVLMATVASAVRAAAAAGPGLPILAGGKSMGGRMTSMTAARGNLPEGVGGLVFFGFPLHQAGKPSSARGEHLAGVRQPMLFLQGTRDALADLGLLRPICERLGTRASLHVVEGADHSFHVLKRSGRSDSEVMDELVDAVSCWSSERPEGAA